MYKAIIAAFAALFGMGAAAHAADLGGSFKDAPAAYGPGYSWAGLYVGGSAGFGVGDTSGKITDFDFDFDREVSFSEGGGEIGGLDLGALFSSEYDVNGAIYGAHLGYNFQHGKYVFGIEAGLNGTDIDGSTDVLVIGKSERELDWYATLVGRLGYAQGNMLFYGFGGVAWGTVETTLSIPLITGASISGESDHVGWTAGVGVEYAFNDRFSVRVEYSHVDLGEETATLGGDFFSVDDEVDLSFDAIKIGASFKLHGTERGLDSMK